MYSCMAQTLAYMIVLAALTPNHFRKKGATDESASPFAQQTPLFVEPIIAYLSWFVKQT